MAANRDISEYFEIEIKDLRPGFRAPFNIFLYLARNSHVIFWRKAGEMISADFIKKYEIRGLKKVWVHRWERDAYHAYLAALARIDAAESTPGKSDAPFPEMPGEEDLPLPKQGEILSVQGAKILDWIGDPDLEAKRKKALVAREARGIVQQSASAEDMQIKTLTDLQAKRVVLDVLEHSSAVTPRFVFEAWNLANGDPSLEHAINVATYATLFAMSIGVHDAQLISDVATAGVLHDVGFSQVPIHIAGKPWKEIASKEMETYSSHVAEGARLVAEFAPDVSIRTREFTIQSHEKFDGTGYPRSLQGSEIQDFSQIVSLADFLDSLCSGLWDGEERTLSEALKVIEKQESAQNSPEFFNPDVLGAILRWLRSPELGQVIQDVSQDLTAHKRKPDAA